MRATVKNAGISVGMESEHFVLFARFHFGGRNVGEGNKQLNMAEEGKELAIETEKVPEVDEKSKEAEDGSSASGGEEEGKEEEGKEEEVDQDKSQSHNGSRGGNHSPALTESTTTVRFTVVCVITVFVAFNR